MGREIKSFSLSTFIIFFFFTTTTTTTVKAATFTCNSPPTTTCQSLAGYVPTNSTTLKDIQSLFQLPSLASLLSTNNLSLSTPSSYQPPLNSPLLIPFPCTCSNGTGVSDHTPIYTVKPTDTGLFEIATTKFNGFITYQEIGRVNNLKDVNVIDKGQKLWIPLPCSCDEVGGEKVEHLAYVVPSGSSVEAIGKKFGVDASVLMKLNGMADSKSLQAGQILDVPLKVGEAPAPHTAGGSPVGEAPAPHTAGGSPGGSSPPNNNSGRLRMNGYKIQILFFVQIVSFWFSFFV